MKTRPLGMATAALLLSIASCDSEAACEEDVVPTYTSQPGVWVCEDIVEECGSLCEIDPTYSPIVCTDDTIVDFVECASGVIDRESLQGVEPDTQNEARVAAQHQIGSGFDCSYFLSSFPVFCFGCND